MVEVPAGAGLYEPAPHAPFQITSSDPLPPLAQGGHGARCV